MLAADKDYFPIRLPARLYSCGTSLREWKCRRLMWLTGLPREWTSWSDASLASGLTSLPGIQVFNPILRY